MSQETLKIAENPYGLDSRDRATLGFARVRDAAFDAIYRLWMKRREQGLSQKELAERLGRDQAWVSRALAGPGNWTLRTLGEMAECLDAFVEIQAKPKESIQPGNFNIYAAQEPGFQSEGTAAPNQNFGLVEDPEYNRAIKSKIFTLGLKKNADH